MFISLVHVCLFSGYPEYKAYKVCSDTVDFIYAAECSCSFISYYINKCETWSLKW